MSVPTVDLVIIGAGPAGLAAAEAALHELAAEPRFVSTRRSAGAGQRGDGSGPRIVVIDSADQPGGQFWRHRTETAGTDDGRLHHGWDDYLALRAGFDAGIAAGIIDYRPATSVWMVEAPPDRTRAGFTVCTTPSHGPTASEPGDRSPVLHARRLIIATGGYDRQLPIPGWDLPGVMAAGGIQGFAKQNGMLPGSRFVIAGTGPFLLPVAANITDLGGDVAAVLESSSLTGWLAHAHRAAGVPAKALEGAEYAWAFLRHRIPYRTRTVVTEILGDGRVEAVTTARIDRLGAVVPGTEATLENIDAVGLGWGFTPQLELPVALGARTRVDVDGSLVAVVDESQRSSVPGLFLAGEVTGVGGAVLAAAEGRLAGAQAAAEITGASPDDRTAAHPRAFDRTATRRTIARHRAFAEAMHRAHPVPPGWTDRLTPETIVCRCEEVPAATIAEASTTLEADDARAQKNMTRAGMGWCQGRECGFAVTCLATGAPDRAESSSLHASLAQTMKRPVAQPVPLSTFFDL
ncbi:FAD-dependent oxidoreductase [Brevibacterium sp. 2SA]|uniref:FAD-dependent oxidoreductase n=1 Tax=Brevibacterium sp. 2SA TaxID=2502198 RepID=UPI0010F78D26|nr:FAD-dependent oxidoreductase [Brevibacterium sp. 2SA]